MGTCPSSVFSFCFRTKLCEEAHLIFGGGVGKHLIFVEVKRNIWQICSESLPFQADKWVLKVCICARAHLLHLVHLKKLRAGDAWLVARLDEIFHHPDKKKRNIAQPGAGDAWLVARLEEIFHPPDKKKEILHSQVLGMPG